MIDKLKKWFFTVFLSNYVGGFTRKALAWTSGFLIGEEIATEADVASWEELTYKIIINLIPWLISWGLSIANKKINAPAMPKLVQGI